MTEATKPRTTRAKAAVKDSDAPGVEMEFTEGPGTAIKVPEEKQPSDMTIYERIAAISREAGALAPEQKGGVPFPFRGVDGTVNHLTPFLNKYGVFLAPAGVSHIVTEREITDKQGNPTGRIVKTSQVEQNFDVYGPDGFGFTVQTAGLADDFADRSTAQAQSVAYRIALLQLFHLPTMTKEPEEAGEDTQKQIADAVSGGATKGGALATPAAVTKAQTAPTSTTSITRLQNEAKALGRKLGKQPSDLNDLGAKLSGGKDVDVWFNDPLIMEQIVDKLRSENEAAAGA